MVELAFLIGIFSYLVFALGLLGRLERTGELLILFFGVIFYWSFKKNIWLKFKSFWQEIKRDGISLLLVVLLLLQILVNLIGAIGPELGFDALWYHLTLPKIYLQWNKIFYLPGGLFYYSAMPKLTEMIYLASLSLSSLGILAKLIHFSFGILTSIVLYNLARRYLNPRFSLLTILVFYTTLIVGWQSITAYTDLARTFFEVLSLERFLFWWEKKKDADKISGWRDLISKNMELFESAIMLGLAISTKLLTLVTLPVFLILILIKSKNFLFFIFYFLFSIFIVCPWLVFAFIHTGNPLFPIFSGILDQSHQIVSFNFLRFFRDIFNLLFLPQDPISPIFLVFLPLVIRTILGSNLKKQVRIVTSYVFISLIFWYFTPRTGGSRFILPYLPAWSLLLSLLISGQKIFYQQLFLTLVILVSLIHLGYRAIANAKFLPVILGKETNDYFLSRKLNYNFGDFYDVDGELREIIGTNDLVLIHGSHNLFYVDFPFIHSSFAKEGTYFSYVLTQDASLPKTLGKLRLIYQDPRSKVKLYLFGQKLPSL